MFWPSSGPIGLVCRPFAKMVVEFCNPADQGFLEVSLPRMTGKGAIAIVPVDAPRTLDDAVEPVIGAVPGVNVTRFAYSLRTAVSEVTPKRLRSDPATEPKRAAVPSALLKM